MRLYCVPDIVLRDLYKLTYSNFSTTLPRQSIFSLVETNGNIESPQTVKRKSVKDTNIKSFETWIKKILKRKAIWNG